ncbi:MAG: hypothetical protein IH966_04855 [Gemmatimonadetes bacterium]|nr:hypothetical protein [Gemmatimonadota bacterium]
MGDRRFANTIKIIETPKGADPVANDRRMLRLLRSWGDSRRGSNSVK